MSLCVTFHNFSFFDCFLGQRGYRVSRRHIAENRCFCKRRARLLCEQNQPLEGSRKKKYKFEQVWCLVQRQSATQVSFLKIYQLIVIYNPSVVSFKTFTIFYFLKISGLKWRGRGVCTLRTLTLDSLMSFDFYRGELGNEAFTCITIYKKKYIS